MDELFEQQVLALEKIATGQQQLTLEGEELLKKICDIKGYYYGLQTIYLDKNNNNELRLMAAIEFKNGMQKYWRNTAIKHISGDEKDEIRKRIIELDPSEYERINIHYNIAVSKIARWDFPIERPNVLDEMVQAVEYQRIQANANGRTREALFKYRNALLVLHSSVKLNSRRAMSVERNAFKKFSGNAIGQIKVWYMESISGIRASIDVNQNIVEELKILRMEIKILRRIIGNEFDRPETSADAIEIYQNIGQNMIELYGIYMGMGMELGIETGDVREVIEKVIKGSGKLYLELSKHEGETFLMIPGSVEVLKWYGSVIGAGRVGGNHIVVAQGLLLYNRILTNVKYQPDLAEDGNTGAAESRAIMDSQLMTSEQVGKMAEALITKYMVYEQEQIVEMVEDVEEWLLAENIQYWEGDIRKCAEKLFSELARSYSQAVLEPFITTLTTMETAGYSVGVKEALINAVGLCSSVISKEESFEQWFLNLITSVGNSVSGDEHHQQEFIVRMRVAKIIGNFSAFINGKMSEENRNTVFRVLVGQFLSYSVESSLVVRLSAVMSLHELVDDWEFKESEFMQYLEQSVISLAELLIRPELSDSKTRVFKCLLILVQRLESKIMPYVHDIFCHVRDAVQMYTSKAASDSDPIFMGTVIEMVCTLVSVLGYSQSQQNEQPDQPIFYIENFLEFIVPLIRYSIENSLHVLEDGTILWRYTLHSLSDTTLPLMVGNNHPASILLDLFISLCEMFEHCGSTEYFDDYFDLVSSYILLGIASTIPGPDNIYMNKLISVLTMLLDSDTYSSAVLEPITEIIDYLFLKNSEIAQTQLLLDCLNSSGFIESITKPSLLSSDYSKSYVALFISRLLVLPFSFGSLGSTFEPIISNIINHLVSTGIDLMDILVVGYQRYESVEYNPNNTRFQLLLAFATAILAGLGYGSNSVASPNNHAVTYTQLVNDVWLPTLAFNSEEEIISAISSEDSPSYELPHLHRRLVALKSDLVLNYPWKLFLHSRLMHLDLTQFRGNASGKGNELDPGYSQTKLSRNFLDFLATEMESAEFADEFAEMLQS